jgi:PAS domain S-box-containing protein
MGAEDTTGDGVGTARPTRRVLYVDNDTSTRAAVQECAEGKYPDLLVETAESGETARARTTDWRPDCVVAEYDLPDCDGLRLYERLRADGYDGPFVLFTAHEPATIAREAFAAGVDDFVQKRPDAEGYEFLFDKVTGAVDSGSRVAYDSGGARRDVETLVALATGPDEGREVVGELSSLLDSVPEPEGVYDAIADVLENDGTFRTHLAREGEEGLTDPRVWQPDDGDGAVEHTRLGVPDEEPVSVVDIFRDVSAEYERAERIERFERLLDTAQDGLYALDANGFYTYVNESMAGTLRYDREELLGMHAGEILGRGEYDRGQQHVQELVDDDGRESEVMEVSVERADGTELPVAIHYSPLYDEAGNYDGLVGVMRDISERKERERRYRTLAENIPQGSVSMFDPDLCYTLVGGQLFESIDYDPDFFEGKTIAESHTDGYVERFEPLYKAVLEGEHSSFEFSHAGRYYRTNLAPIRDTSGTVTAGLEMVLDVTEQHEYKRELERQNERLGEFASIVSHDLRNPLNVIEGRLQLYREGGSEDHLDIVEDNVERMGMLIDDLLDLAQKGQSVGDVERLTLESFVQQCWESVDTAGATLETDDLGAIAADPGRLEQLFGNLFGNAVEHGGSPVRVRVGLLDDGFYVADDGPGIPPERREKVLEYGVTDSKDGTGIGLAIVSEIAQAHGWSVTVTESDDGGARFEFTGIERP